MKGSFQTPGVNEFLLKHYITSKYDREARTSKKGLTHPQMKKEAYQDVDECKEEKSDQLNNSLEFVAMDMV
mgnify:CR=1 FL=1